MKDHLIENEYDRTYCVGRYRTAGYCYVGLSKDGKLLLGVVRRPKDKHKWLGELPTNKDCYDTIEASKKKLLLSEVGE